MRARGATISRSLEAFRQIDDRWGVAQVLTDVADVDLRTENYAAANGALLEALGIFRELGHQRGVARQLERLSWCAGCQRRDEAAVRLASAAAAIRQRIGAPIKRLRADEDRRDACARQSAPRSRGLRRGLARGAHGDARIDSRGGAERAARGPALLIFLRVDQVPDGGDPAGRDADLARVFANRGFVRSEVHAVDFLVRHVAVEPLNLGSHSLQDLQRAQGHLPDLAFGHPARSRHVPLDNVLRHTVTRKEYHPVPESAGYGAPDQLSNVPLMSRR